jgi:CRISPR-associated protein Csb1
MSHPLQQKSAPRLLIEATLKPVQGDRFQPTGFPDLGHAEYLSPDGTEKLLVESVQSMANRLEAVCWSEGDSGLVGPLQGLPYVVAALHDGRKTNSILEAHRLSSPYIMKAEESSEKLKGLWDLKESTNVSVLAKEVFRYDPNSVLHGVFLEDISGSLRLKRLLSSFIEASGVRAVDSGGTKVDRLDPTGKMGAGKEKGASEGYGNVPFARREFTAKEIKAYFNLDLAQMRAYGLGGPAEELLFNIALYKILRFLNVGLRLRTACDLRLDGATTVTEPTGWPLPSLESVEEALPRSIEGCRKSFASPPVTELEWKPPNKKPASSGEKEEEEGTEEAN